MAGPLAPSEPSGASMVAATGRGCRCIDMSDLVRSDAQRQGGARVQISRFGAHYSYHIRHQAPAETSRLPDGPMPSVGLVRFSAGGSRVNGIVRLSQLASI
jgi:hypothetical protein